MVDVAPAGTALNKDAQDSAVEPAKPAERELTSAVVVTTKDNGRDLTPRSGGFARLRLSPSCVSLFVPLSLPGAHVVSPEPPELLPPWNPHTHRLVATVAPAVVRDKMDTL